MRILIYGAGVIGSFYASRFAKAGLDVTVLARGQRLKELQGHGLWYRGKTRTHKVEVKTISELKPNDRYQFIFLTVRENQVEEALEDISRNESPNVVTMVNTIKPYGRWEKICGKGRILPAFPGAGGCIEGGILDAQLLPRAIQPTTFGEIGGRKSSREEEENRPTRCSEPLRSWVGGPSEVCAKFCGMGPQRDDLLYDYTSEDGITTH